LAPSSEAAPAAGGICAEYVRGGAVGFYGAHYGDAAARRQAVRRARRPLAPDVADAIEAQSSRLPPSAARDAHLTALRRGAAAVVTGQQVGLFLGPLFTIYKAATAVVAARALAAECGEPVVPVFWLQSEDHDLPEIAECHLPRAGGGVVTLRLPAPPGERMSMAHRRLPAAIDDCLRDLEDEIGGLPFAAHLERLREHYVVGARWADAFAGVLAGLFADDGLLFIDPRAPRLSPVAAPIHERALADAAAIAAALTRRCEELAAAGFDPTVHVRAGAPLSFIHPGGAAGPRYRLEPARGGFAEVGGNGVHDAASLRSLLARDPGSFSTSVLLRPILQDKLLPTAVFVGGPAEVAYFAQLQPLYAAYDMEMPIVLPRAAFRLIEERTAKILARLQVQPDDVSAGEELLLAAAAREAGVADDMEMLSRRLLDPFERALRDARGDIEAAGQGLDVAVEKTRAAVTSAVAKLVAKIERARLHRDDHLIRDVRYLRERLYPHGLSQERVFSLPYFAARYGEQPVLRAIVDAIDPFAPAMKDLLLA
jgi:bacillithiol biosynthesis cysteine-adding enzyme BshC